MMYCVSVGVFHKWDYVGVMTMPVVRDRFQVMVKQFVPYFPVTINFLIGIRCNIFFFFKMKQSVCRNTHLAQVKLMLPVR